MNRSYRAVRLQGRDRPYRRPGRLTHAQELNDEGSAFAPGMAICGRTPREESDGFGDAPSNLITCERCKERMR